ncbi:hypothetical protein ACFW9O_14030 [Streptomyces sp. NPDC059499]|uniref:hypothetical protein n=1 Tax=Streptomyces sp. NPDC059499 TaxID=3346852 RepID=UPI0036C06AF4
MATRLPHRLDLQGAVPDRELSAGLLFHHITQLGHDLLVTGLAYISDVVDLLGMAFSPSMRAGARS